MKWYSDNQTTMVDTSAVNYYHYDIHNNILSLVINGHTVLLHGQEATELFETLKEPVKQLLTEEGQ